MPIIREGVESKITRMGKVEVQTGPMGRTRYERFSICISHKTDLVWISIQILSQQSPQNPMCNYPAKTIFFKVKLLRPPDFFFRKNALQRVDQTGWGLDR